MIFSIMVGMCITIVIILFNLMFTVPQQHIYLITRFGRFSHVAHSGLNAKMPFIDTISGAVNLRICQLNVAVETKTLDNVFVDIVASVQYRVLPSKVYEAFYVLQDAETQIQSFVFDVIRARVPMMQLDEVFSEKDKIADSVKAELQSVMNDFGYDIIKALVTDIKPDHRVKKAMNEINEAQRLRVAANERGEAEKILKVKQAEADAESKILQGQGIAGQRRAIMEGLKESLGEFQKQIGGGTSQHDAMTLLMMAQYFDTLKDISSHSAQNTILLPHSPAGMTDIFDQMRNAIIVGNKITETKETDVKNIEEHKA